MREIETRIDDVPPFRLRYDGELVVGEGVSLESVLLEARHFGLPGLVKAVEERMRMMKKEEEEEEEEGRRRSVTDRFCSRCSVCEAQN